VAHSTHTGDAKEEEGVGSWGPFLTIVSVSKIL
jgi:hypothetical protein